MADPPAVQQRLPVGALDTRASGWWAMIFVIFTEAALFAYLLFSYFYIAVQPHLPGTFPPGGAPSLTLALPNTLILLLSSAAVAWAQFNIEHDRPLRTGRRTRRRVHPLGTVFVVIQYFEWAQKTFTLSSSGYGSLYFTVTGFHMAHVIAGVIMLVGAVRLVAHGLFQSGCATSTFISVPWYWHFVDAVWIVVFFTFYLTPLMGLKS